MSQISFQNSLTTRDITSPFTFNGEYVDITSYAEVNVLLQGNLPLAGDYYVVTAYLSNDRVNVLETIETNVTYPISNKLIKITPTANFIKIKLETFALDVITNFNMSTVLRIILPLSNMSVFGVVEVSNFPVTQPVSISDTVAVSGTFYPVTQPVSISDTVAVSGTFYPDTQPVSIATELDTNIKTIDTAVTFQCQERPTTESYFTTAVGTNGLAILH